MAQRRLPRRAVTRGTPPAFAVTLFAALVYAAPCAHAATLRIGMVGDAATLDPAQSSSVTDRVAFAAFCDKLIDLDDKLGYVPQLATAWTWGDDGLSLTLQLRDGVTFHDGTPFDAEAVRFNLERYKTAPYSRRKAELAPVRAVTVVDSRTVRLELSEPFVPLLAQLADRSGMMVSPKAARELGENFATHPVCAGPYRFVEWVAQDRIVFDRFEPYWNRDAIGIDRLVYQPIPDDTVRLANLRAGGLQLIERVAPTDVPTVRGDARLRLAAAPSVGYRLLSINTNKGPAASAPLGANASLREAFELSLDREAINQTAFDGAFVPSNQPEPPGSPFYDKALPVPPRDLARAKAIVAASGASRVPVTLLISTDPLDGQVAQIIQAMAGDAGFDVKIEVTEGATLLGRLKSGTYELALLIWSGRPDPDANIAMWVACDGFINWGAFCDPKLDEILKRARSAAQQDERAGLYAQAAAIYLAARPYIFLYHLKWYWGLSGNLDGFVPHPDGIIHVSGLRLRQ
jgi:peptide/nickel transport system substrate-binding protein